LKRGNSTTVEGDKAYAGTETRLPLQHGFRDLAGSINLMKLNRRVPERIGEREQCAGFWMAAIMRAKPLRSIAAGSLLGHKLPLR
jgi:hypothetical protein